MATEGLRKHSTTLFNGVVPSQVQRVSRLLDKHRNLTNHQICITSSEVLSAGKYSVLIIPDAPNTTVPVDTGLILDMTGRNSALLTFTGVIRGVILQIAELIPENTANISAVISSFARYRRTSVLDDGEQLDFVTTDMGVVGSSKLNVTKAAGNHRNLVYHQLSVTSSIPTENVYKLRFLPEGDGNFESTVDTGYELDFAGGQSALIRFGCVMSGIHLEAVGSLVSGGELRIVLSSSLERFDELVYDYIGLAPDLGDHVSDTDNPHETSWDNLVNRPSAFPDNTYLEDTLVIPDNHQMLIWEKFEIDNGVLNINPGGRMVILHDRPEARATNPDFTYNGSGQLTQIDYTAGEQKLFTYDGGGQLIQVDSTKLNTTLRKAFTYTGGGELDYITETWL